MATLGIITSEGISKSIDLQNGEGFKIIPYKFAVSAIAGELSKLRTIADLQPVWYENLISAGIKLDSNTVQFYLNIPPNAQAEPTFTKEVYLIAKDENDEDFLLGLCQPSVDLTYDPEGELRLRVQFNLDNVNIADLYEFKFTQAMEIEEHDLDINAHPIIKNALKKHGIYLANTDARNAGQLVDIFPVHDGALLARDVVYFNEVGAKYEKAVADPTSLKRYAVGVYDVVNDTVMFGGVFDYPHSEPPYTKLYLSDSVEGAITLTPTSVFIGYTLNNNRAILDILVTDETESVVDPDGDTTLLLAPPVIRELVIADEDGVKWEVTVDNSGKLSTTQTSKRLSSLFRIVRADLAFGNLEVKTDGTLYTKFPGHVEYVIDNHFYMVSPDQNAWKMGLDLDNQIVMETHSNRYSITAPPYRLFEVRQLLSGKGAIGVPLVTLEDMVQVQQTIVDGDAGNFVYFDPKILTRNIFVPIQFNEEREWSSIGFTIGDQKISYIGDTNFFKMNGNCWLKMNGQSCAGTRYAEMTGNATVPTVTNGYIKVN